MRNTKLATQLARHNTHTLLNRHTPHVCDAATSRLRQQQPRMMGGGVAPPSKKDNFKYSGRLRPEKQSPTRKVPSQIPKPDYAADGRPKATGPLLPWQIETKTDADIAGMRAAGRVAREVLDAAGRALAVGVTTDSIDAVVHEETLKRGAYP